MEDEELGELGDKEQEFDVSSQGDDNLDDGEDVDVDTVGRRSEETMELITNPLSHRTGRKGVKLNTKSKPQRRGRGKAKINNKGTKNLLTHVI